MVIGIGYQPIVVLTSQLVHLYTKLCSPDSKIPHCREDGENKVMPVKYLLKGKKNMLMVYSSIIADIFSAADHCKGKLFCIIA